MELIVVITLIKKFILFTGVVLLKDNIHYIFKTSKMYIFTNLRIYVKE